MYADKTEYIWKLFQQKRSGFFLSRPIKKKEVYAGRTGSI